MEIQAMTGHAARAGVALAATTLLLSGCGGEGGGTDSELSGTVSIDGSSTLYPITEAVAEEFQRAHPRVRVTVGVSGTGGGFKMFCNGETGISDASRTITESEREACAASGVEFIEIPVAWDGMTVAVNPRNDWAECITTEELRRVWQPGSSIDNWSEIRNEWPDRELVLYGPGTSSGTFDYFTEAIMGEEDASRSDYTASEDDNVLVIGVEGDLGSLGYFGYAYYEENQSRVKALEVDDGTGCVAPTPQTIESGEYEPLSRPLYIYVNESALQRPEVRAFVDFYLENAGALVPQVGYVPLSPARYDSLRSELPGGDTVRAEPTSPSDTAGADAPGPGDTAGAGRPGTDTTDGGR